MYCVCPSRLEKRPLQSCNYFEFVDQLDEDVTSTDSALYVTREEFDVLKSRFEALIKLLKFGLVIVIVLIIKCFM